MPFQLHSRLNQDTALVGDLALSRILLMNDARFPWLVLVPRVSEAREIIDLPPSDRSILIEEIALAAEALKTLTAADKLNIAAIGNIVPQLHVHVVARTVSDDAWPAPVWNFGQSRPYEDAALREMIVSMQQRLDASLNFRQPQ